jgi:hypothetical protein
VISWQNSRNDRCPTVKWSGIQNTLEESHSDVLILLDCCASGVCTTDEGNGVTELIAACAYNAIANGVGPLSFTHALISRLRALAPLPYFTIGFLYNALFTEIQGWRVEDPRYKKAPVHLVLSQNNERPRSIRLSSHLTKRDPQVICPDTPDILESAMDLLSLDTISTSSSAISASEPKSSSNESIVPSQTSIGKRPTGLWPPGAPSPMSSQDIPEYPRLLFSIRIQEDVKSGDLSVEMFTDWLRDVPVSSGFVRVEAGFASDSTLLMVSMPAAMLAYLPSDPAVMMLGVIRSKNLMEILCPEDQMIKTKSPNTTQPTSTTQMQDLSTPLEAGKKAHDTLKSIKSRSRPGIFTKAIFANPSKTSPNPSGRLSVSTIGTTSSGTAQSAYTLPDDTFSDRRASVMTSNSSITTESQPSFAISIFRRPKHDPINGIWNNVLRVIPCKIDHSGCSWDGSFQICSICGFSQWHSLMLNAQSMNVREFTAAMDSLSDTRCPDFAGNSSTHYLLSTGCNLEYLTSLRHLGGESYIYDQNVFGQNPLHVINPDTLGQDLIRLLEWFKIDRQPPGLLLTQRDIHGRTPLHTLLCHPLDTELYSKIFDIFPFIVHQLRGVDISGRSLIQMMAIASLEIRPTSGDDYNKLEKGVKDIKTYLAIHRELSPSGSGTEKEYGFHDIARGARGTTWAEFFECRICNRVNAHSNSYLEQMECACARGRDRGAPDADGMTPAHALITCKRANDDHTHESPAETAELFRLLVPANKTTLREVLHVLDPDGNNLVHNVAVRGFHEILEYILLLERPERRRAMVNACAKNQKGEEISVLTAVEEEIQKITERIRTASSFLSRDPVRGRFLGEFKSQLLKVKEILQREGAEMNPSVNTRWRIT